jgi:hypothetical protein
MAYRESPAANEAQRRSASYELAELDREFLLGDSMRGVRLQLECAKVEEEQQAWGVRSTIVIFGGHDAAPRSNSTASLFVRSSNALGVAGRRDLLTPIAVPI